MIGAIACRLSPIGALITSPTSLTSPANSWTMFLHARWRLMPALSVQAQTVFFTCNPPFTMHNCECVKPHCLRHITLPNFRSYSLSPIKQVHEIFRSRVLPITNSEYLGVSADDGPLRAHFLPGSDPSESPYRCPYHT